MVAVFTGLGSGFERGSGAALGGAGLLGSGIQGRGGDNISVNAATGNLLINRRDEFLVGLGPDVGISRIYNSLGALDENGDHWRQGTDRRVYKSGNDYFRVSADGSEIKYVLQTVDGEEAYWTNEGGGSYDKLTFDAGTSKWTWTDGDNQNTEVYEADGVDNWRIVSHSDNDGNTVTYEYTAGKLTKIETADGGYLKYTWSGDNITSIESYANGGSTITHTRTYYTYTADRLTKVTTDLTPADNSIADGAVYETSYTYVNGSPDLIETITQTDGSKLEMIYDGQSRVTELKQTVLGSTTRSTEFQYDQVDELGRAMTRVTSPDNQITDLIYDYRHQLIEIRSPEPAPSQGRPTTSFEYDEDGNVTEVVDARGERTSYQYDSRGNTTRITDANGNITYRQYDENNNLLLETRAGERGHNLLQGGDLSQGAAIFSTSSGYTTTYNGNTLSYSQGIETVDGEDAFVIETTGYHEYNGTTGSRLASSNGVYGGDLDGGTSFSVLSGESITVGFEAKRLQGEASSFAHMFVDFLDASGNRVEFKYIYADAQPGWQRGAGAIEVPEGAVKVKLYVYTYGRDADTVETGAQPEPGVTEFALRNFQFARGGISSENFLGEASQLSSASFLAGSYDHGGGITSTAIETVDGELALVFRDTASTGSGSTYTGSSHYINGGDLDDGEYYSVESGDVIALSLEAAALVGNAGSAGMYVYFYDAQNNYLTNTGIYPTDLTDGQGNHVWKTKNGSIVAPENAVKYKVYLNHFNRLYVGSGDPGTSHVAVRNLEVLNLGKVADIDTYTLGQNRLPGGNLSQGISLISTFAGYTNVYDNNPLHYTQNIQAIDGQDAIVVTTNGYHEYSNGSRLASSNSFLSGDLNGGTSYSVDAGEVVSIGFEAKRLHVPRTSDSSFAHMFVDFLDENGNRVDYKYLYAYDADDWTRAIDKMVVPEGAVKVTLSVYTYGRAHNTSEPEPGETSFALRNFQLSQDALSIENQLSVAAQLSDASFLVNTNDYGDDGTFAIESVNVGGTQDTALVFDDEGSTGTGAVYYGSSHTISGGDLDNGESYSAAAGDTISLSIEATALIGDAGSAGLYVYFYDENDNVLTSTGTYPTDLQDGSNAPVWKSTGRTIVAPANTAKYKVFIYHFTRLYVGTGDPGQSKVAVRSFEVRNLGQALAYSAPEGDPNAWGIAHTRYIYDDENHLRFTVSAEGNVTEYEYRNSGEIEKIKSYTSAAFNSDAISLSETELQNWINQLGTTDISEVHNFYDASGQLSTTWGIASLDGSGSTSDGYSEIHYLYDQSGQLLKRHSVTGQIIAHDWANSYEGVETFAYDGLGRLISSTDASGGSTSIVFDDANTQTVVTTGLGYTKTSVYDKAGELISETDSGTQIESGTLNYAYDDAGRLRTMSEMTGPTTSYNTYYLYDDLGRQTAVIGHDGSIAETRYDQQGRVIATARYAYKLSSTDLGFLANANHSKTIEDVRPSLHSYDIWQWTVYDGRGQVIQTIDGDGSTSHFAYDYAGRLVSTKSFYNKLGVSSYWDAPLRFQVTPDAHASDAITRTFYNRDGRVVGTLNGEGHLSHNIYDAAGQKVQSLIYADETDSSLRDDGSFEDLLASITPDANKDINQRYIYDGNGNLRFEVDSNGYVTQYDYVDDYAATDVLVTGVVRQTIEYADAISPSVYTVQSVKTALAALTWNSTNRVTRMVYNDKNQLSFSVNSEGGVTGFTYDADGRVVKTTQYEALYDPGNVSVPTHAALAANRLANTSASDRIAHNYYTSRGELGATIDAAGYVTRWIYDDMGRKVSETRWDVHVSEIPALAGDRNLLTLSTINANISESAYTDHIKTTFEYDSLGRLSSIYDPDGTRQFIGYHGNGEQSWAISSFGHATEEVRQQTVYDSAGKAIYDYRWTDYAAGQYNYSRYYYDGLGNKDYDYYRYYNASDSSDPNALNYGTHPTYFSHDKNGNVTARITASGAADQSVEYLEYDGFGNVTQHTDGRGHQSYTYYDNLGRVQMSVDAEGSVTTFVYNSFGEIQSQTRHYIQVDVSSLTVDTPPTLSTHANDATTSYTYDRLGQVDLVTDARNDVTDTDYTVFGEVDTVTRDGAITSFAYTDRGLVESTTDARNFTESYEYDGYGNRIKTTNKLGGITTYLYDNLNRLESETTSQNVYDSVGNLIALSVTNAFAYDTRGNMITKTEAVGLPEQRVTIYRYDNHDRLVETEHESVDIATATGALTAHTPIEKVSYDVLGNVSRTTDANGAETFYYYDERNRLIHQVSPEGTLTAHSYDANDNIVETKVYGDRVVGALGKTAPAPNNSANYRTTTFVYDKQNRMIESRVPSIQTAALNGNLAITTADLVTSYQYDAFGNVIKTTNPSGHSTYSYYDEVGNKTHQVDAGGFLTKWEYDENGNVTNETRYATLAATPVAGAVPPSVSVDSINDRTTLYLYDANGQRIREQRLNVKIHDDNNAGNETNTTATILFEYNALGQISKKTEATGETINYVYDAQGRMTKEWRSGYTDFANQSVTPEIIYDYNGLNDLARTTASGWNDASQTTPVRSTHYTYGTGGRLATVTDAEGFIHTYRYDAKGQTVRDEYTRLDADGTTHLEAVATSYDLEGRAIAQGIAVNQGGSWTNAVNAVTGASIDTVYTHYNAYGQMDGRGMNITGAASDVNSYTERFEYDAAGRMWKSNAGDGVWKIFMYDENGNQSLAVTSDGTDLAGKTVANLISDWGSAANIGTTDISGMTATLTQYDARNQAVLVKEPKRDVAGGPTDLNTSRTYNAFGDISSETDARSNTIDYSYNTMGRRIKVESPSVSITNVDGSVDATHRPTEHYYYDVSGRLVASRDANNNLTRQTLLSGTGYNGTEALVTRVDYVDGFTTTGYDIHGNARTMTDEIGRITTQAFDRMGRVTRVDHQGSIAYEANATLADYLVDEYSYDGRGQRISHHNNQGGYQDSSFSNSGFTLGGVTAGSNLVATSIYDHQGRVIEQTARGGDTTSMSYVWDASITAGGLGTFGGWEQITTYVNSKTLTEKTDVFGHKSSTVDLGGTTTNFTYNAAGQAISQSGGNTISYAYLNTSKVGTIAANGKTTTYGYDAAGNMVSQLFKQGTTTLQSSTAGYDALGRMTEWDELGGTATPAASIDYTYDANGNIRSSTSSHYTLNADGSTSASQDTDTLWYKYDARNRVTLSQGDLVGSSIVRGDNGVEITYNGAGQRTSTWRSFADVYDHDIYINGVKVDTIEIDFTNETRESYSYNAAGHLATVKTSQGYVTSEPQFDVNTGEWIVNVSTPVTPTTVRSTFAYDLMGRRTSQVDYQADGSTTAFSKSTTYDGKGQVIKDGQDTRQSDNTVNTADTYFFYRGETVADPNGSPWVDTTTGLDSNSALGQVTRSWTLNWDNGAEINPSETVYSYVWDQGAVQSETLFYKDVHNRTAADTDDSDFNYVTIGGRKQLNSVSIADGQSRTVNFVTDAGGQIIERDVVMGSDDTPRDITYRFGGKQMGQISNNGTNNMNFHDSIEDREPNGGSGIFRNGSTVSQSYTDFDQSYSAINSYAQGSGAGTYTVRSGDTLQGIAAGLYGDSGLWYKIAGANGLSGSSQLIAGTTLTLPSGITRNTNTASTFNPYNPGEAIGDVAPTAPEPPKDNKCGVFGAIILAVVAVAVTLITYNPAAGQGLLSGFIGSAATTTTSAAGVVTTTAATGLTASIGATAATAVGGALAATAGSIASQAVGLATGIQEKFSFKSVALAAIGGGIGGGLGVSSGADKFLGKFGEVGTFTRGVADGLARNVLSQGIGMATGLQSRFDWAGLAAAGVSGGVSAKINPAIGKAAHSAKFGDRLDAAIGIGVQSAAASIAHAATRSAIDGSNFGDNIIASIPDVISQALRGYIAACFVGDTPVHTPHGLKRIDEIKVGDLVYARDEDFKDASVRPRRVLELYRYEDRATLDVTLSFEDGQETRLRTTPLHPFAVIEDRELATAHSYAAGQRAGGGHTETAATFTWTSAEDLTIGARVIDVQGRTGLVTALTPVGTLSTVHNFAVEHDHTYFVGTQGIWVHNQCKTEAIEKAEGDPTNQINSAQEMANILIAANKSKEIVGSPRAWSVENVIDFEGIADNVVHIASSDFEYAKAVDAALMGQLENNGYYKKALAARLLEQDLAYRTIGQNWDRTLVSADAVSSEFQRIYNASIAKNGEFKPKLFADELRMLSGVYGGEGVDPALAVGIKSLSEKALNATHVGEVDRHLAQIDISFGENWTIALRHPDQARFAASKIARNLLVGLTSGEYINETGDNSLYSSFNAAESGWTSILSTSIDTISLATGLGGVAKAVAEVGAKIAARQAFLGRVATKAQLGASERISRLSKVEAAKVNGATKGTYAHTYAEKVLKRYQRRYGDQGFRMEKSYLNGDKVRYGKKGSSRIDVLDTWTNTPFDFKFGKAGLSNDQLAKARINLPSYYRDLIEVRP